jgi:hypothetical protein
LEAVRWRSTRLHDASIKTQSKQRRLLRTFLVFFTQLAGTLIHASAVAGMVCVIMR